MDTFITRLNGMMMLELENLDKEIAKYKDLSKKSSDELANNISNKRGVLNTMRQQYNDMVRKKEQNESQLKQIDKDYITLDIENKKMEEDIKKHNIEINNEKSKLRNIKYKYDMLCGDIKKIQDENMISDIKKQIKTYEQSIKDQQEVLTNTAKTNYLELMKMVETLSIQPTINSLNAQCDAFKQDIMEQITDKFNVKLDSGVYIMDIHRRLKDNYIMIDINDFLQYKKNVYDKYSIIDLFKVKCDKVNDSSYYYMNKSHFNIMSEMYHEKIKEIDHYNYIHLHEYHEHTKNHFYIKLLESRNVSEINTRLIELYQKLTDLHNEFIENIREHVYLIRDLIKDNSEKITWGKYQNSTYEGSICDYINHCIRENIRSPYSLINKIDKTKYDNYSYNEFYKKIKSQNNCVLSYAILYIGKELDEFVNVYNKIKNTGLYEIYNHYYRNNDIISYYEIKIPQYHILSQDNGEGRRLYYYKWFKDHISTHFDLFIEPETVNMLKSLYSDLSRENIKMYCEKLLFDALGKKYDDIYELVYYTNHLIK